MTLSYHNLLQNIAKRARTRLPRRVALVPRRVALMVMVLVVLEALLARLFSCDCLACRIHKALQASRGRKKKVGWDCGVIPVALLDMTWKQWLFVISLT